jgi:hypothetical protein
MTWLQSAVAAAVSELINAHGHQNPLPWPYHLILDPNDANLATIQAVTIHINRE